MILTAEVLVAGEAAGPALVLDEPLSLWGGLDAGSGRIVDRRHPQHGALVRGRVLVMPSGRGSSSSSSVLAEALRLGTGPLAIVLREPDGVLVIGSLVAGELYGAGCPIIVVGAADFARIPDRAMVAIDAEGTLSLGRGEVT